MEQESVMAAAQLKLISHKLCPYVQRAVIALTEKGVPFERVDIDLDNKPDWFLKISPLGKTPVLVVGDKAIFESAVILEYLEETQPNPLHPKDPLARAEHRAWIEFNSTVLGDIWGLEIATDEATFAAKAKLLEGRLAVLEKRLVGTPWFDEIGDFGIFASTPKIVRWRNNLRQRASIRNAVSADYPQLLRDFLRKKGAYLSQLEARKAA
jgi:glutathione S-transferase